MGGRAVLFLCALVSLFLRLLCLWGISVLVFVVRASIGYTFAGIKACRCPVTMLSDTLSVQGALHTEARIFRRDESCWGREGTSVGHSCVARCLVVLVHN